MRILIRAGTAALAGDDMVRRQGWSRTGRKWGGERRDRGGSPAAFAFAWARAGAERRRQRHCFRLAGRYHSAAIADLLYVSGEGAWVLRRREGRGEGGDVGAQEA